ncbi:MAG: hypothetical protein AB3X41_02025 [Leptothrix ochracea]|uniref:hypothetical protein n=1 Tax=Leptothrix ochracea TaxID=735331 RepID=UPI0034E2A37B
MSEKLREDLGAQLEKVAEVKEEKSGKPGAKSQPIDSVVKIVKGGKDPSGYEIVDVLAKGNEYAVYEIEHADINNRLRVFIDGFTDESERALTKRFSDVKQKYIEAKGLLYRSSNFGMMKNRVAHALATALISDKNNVAEEFDQLIASIREEAKEVVFNRASYMFPMIIGLVVSAGFALKFMGERANFTPIWQLIVVALGSSLGGGLAILSKTKNLRFEEYESKFHYFLFGLERVLLALVAGSIAFVLVKARFLFSDIAISSYWSLMAIIIVAGFSEMLVPSFLETMSTKKSQ